MGFNSGFKGLMTSTTNGRGGSGEGRGIDTVPTVWGFLV